MSKNIDTYAVKELEVGDKALGVTSGGDTRLMKLGTDGYDRTGGPTIISKDTLRASVEAASGGRATVLYDNLGLPSYMCVIPAFKLEDIHTDFGTGRHPAFIVNGVKKPEIFIGMHLASVYQSKALSLPGLDPATAINWDNASLRCTAKGSGWHLLTNWEWAAVVLWTMKQVSDGILPGQPRGNTNYGRAHDEYQETGTRRDGDTYDPGEATGSAMTLTGSGPNPWRHDFSPAGVADMVGNVWEWVGGMKIIDGAIKMSNDNHYTQADSLWTDQAATVTSNGTWNTDRTSGGDAARLRAALIKPATAVTNGVSGYCYVDVTGERLPLRGGSWYTGSGAGLGTLNLYNARSSSGASIGFRPAFVAP